MKIKRSLVVGCLTALLGVGAAVGAGVSAEKAPVKEAEAISNSQIYLIGSFNGWKTNDPNYEFHTGVGLGNQHVIVFDASVGDEFKIYYNNGYIAPIADLKINNVTIFTANGSDNAKCSVAGRYAFYLPSNWKTDYNDKRYGLAIERSVFEKTNPEASASSFRVWTRATFNWWYSDSAFTGCKVVTTAGEKIYKMDAVLNADDSLYYWYLDIPLTASGIQFVRVGYDEHTIYNYAVYMTDIYGNGVYYINDQTEGSDQKVSFGAVDNPSTAFFGKVFETFLTCSNSDKNGFGAYDGLYNHFYSKLTSSEKSALSSVIINDYADGDTSYSGTKSRSTDLATKWALFEANAKGTSPYTFTKPVYFFEEAMNNSSIWIIVVSSVTLLGVAGFFFIKRRKHDR